jgi:hypothetical protein
MANYNLYKVLTSIFEEELPREETEEEQENKDIKTIDDFLKNYSVLKGVKNILISFGYSDLGLNKSQNLENISDDDIKALPEFDIEKESLEINNKNVITILRFINRKIREKMKEKVFDQNKKPIKVPFIIKISWKYGGIPYYIEASYFNRILIVNDYMVNNSKNQVDKVNKFIKQRKVIKNSPFRLLGSIFIYNDWFYDWNTKNMQSELKDRRL